MYLYLQMSSYCLNWSATSPESFLIPLMPMFLNTASALPGVKCWFPQMGLF